MNQSNKTLITVVSIAVIIFISALIWKQTHRSNEEVVNVISNIKVDNKKTKKRNSKRHTQKTKEISPRSVQTEIEEEIEIEEITEEVKQDIQDVKDDASKKMFNAMKYRTPESIVKAIKQAQTTDNTEYANELYDFLLERFPDFDVPSDI